MKKLILATLLIVNFASTQAADIIAVKSGFWKTPDTWNLNRVPAAGDRVLIPILVTVTIDNVQNYASKELIVNVFGTMKLKSPGKLQLPATSLVTLYPGGTVSGNGSTSEFITIGNTKKFVGIEADIVGPKLANDASGAGFVPFGTLPVKFISYNVVKNGTQYQLYWSTSEELNSDYYEVERSENANDWKSVVRIQAAGNSSTVKNYSYTDRNVNLQNVHYRIKQADQDGRVTYTEIRSFRNNSSVVRIAAGQNQVLVHFPEQVKGSVEIQMISINGQVMATQKLMDPKGQVVVPARSLKGQFVVAVRSTQVSAAQQVVF